MESTDIIDRVKSSFGDLVIDSHNFRGDQTVTIKNERALEFFSFYGMIRICLSIF